MKLYKVQYKVKYVGETFESHSVVPISNSVHAKAEAEKIIKAMIEANPNPNFQSYEIVSVEEVE
jgi:hypothetical protein